MAAGTKTIQLQADWKSKDAHSLGKRCITPINEKPWCVLCPSLNREILYKLDFVVVDREVYPQNFKRLFAHVGL
jgi:hypothetical protein